MIGRMAEIGIIVLLIAWCAAGVVRAEEVTPAPTPSEIVITDDVDAYFGPLGPGSPLYGLKLALENLDEAFTMNQSEKVQKQMDHAELRIAEIKGLLLMNKSGEAERALDAYLEKLNLTAMDLSSIPVRTTGIANAYQQHVKHELVLRDLLEANPNSTKLWRAYNHTLDLEEKFMEKSQVRIEKRVGQLNRITAKVVRINEQSGDKADDTGSTITPTATVTTSQGKGREKQKGQEIPTVTATGTATTTTTSSPDIGSGKDQGKDKGNNGKGPK
jgi:Domain of unknown function (DUF5667)